MPHPTAPHRPFRPLPDLITAASAAVAALSELARFPAAADAAQRALAALSQLGPVVSQLPSAGEGGVERELVGNVEMTGGLVAGGVEQSRDLLNGASQVISSHDASKGLGNNASNQQEHTAWCEMCQVGCNSFQILEQHKNGKRHKKNLQRFEELKRVVQVSANNQDQGTSGVGAVVEGEAPGNIPDDVNCDLRLENYCLSVQPLGSSTELCDQKSSPCKKRECHGNGTIAKRVKNVVTPFVCSVCNVKCDTQEVFDKHLSGKKHFSNVKRSQVRQPRNRQIGLRAVYLNYPMSQVPTSQCSEYQFLIPEGSYLPPQPQVFTPLPLQVHYQVDTAGSASVSPFQHLGPRAQDGSVSLNSRHTISPAMPGVQPW